MDKVIAIAKKKNCHLRHDIPGCLCSYGNRKLPRQGGHESLISSCCFCANSAVGLGQIGEVATTILTLLNYGCTCKEGTRPFISLFDHLITKLNQLDHKYVFTFQFFLLVLIF